MHGVLQAIAFVLAFALFVVSILRTNTMHDLTTRLMSMQHRTILPTVVISSDRQLDALAKQSTIGTKRDILALSSYLFDHRNSLDRRDQGEALVAFVAACGFHLMETGHADDELAGELLFWLENVEDVDSPDRDLRSAIAEALAAYGVDVGVMAPMAESDGGVE